MNGSEEKAHATASAVLPVLEVQAGAGETLAASKVDLIAESKAISERNHEPHRSSLETSNNITFREVDPVDVRVRQLSVYVDSSPSAILAAFRGRDGKARDHVKHILQDISADFPTGTLTACLGASGSGKTSFLNILARRMHGSSLEISGTALFNGSDDISSVRCAYVMQQDILLPTLTVRETLRYAADLRLPAGVSKAERHKIVEEVIMELGLKDAANTRIGNSAHRGCSGGEKRRVSIGVQLLANPSVLFLDEPTTGLDAASAFQLVCTLKSLARKGRTIITTIHQPRSEIWSLFDNILLLTKGRPAFSGTRKECLEYFTKVGFELPPFINPAEHVIDTIAIDTRSEQLEEESSARVDRLVRAWEEHLAMAEKEAMKALEKTKSNIAKSNSERDHHTAFLRQVMVLTSRTWKCTFRDPLGIVGSLVEAFSMAIITGWIFYKPDDSQAGIRTREGALYTAAALQGYLILLYEIYRLSIDIRIFDRERGEGVVGVPAYLVSRRLVHSVMEDIPIPLIYSLIFYFMVGFEPDGRQFLIFFAVMLLEQYIAVCFAMLSVATARSFAGASLISNMSFTLQSFSCGFFIQANSMPVYVRWTKWIAYVYYTFGALCTNEFAGRLYDCPYEGGFSNPACKQFTGDYVLNSLGLPSNWLWRPILIKLGFAIAFFFGAALILQFWRVDLKISKTHGQDESDKSAGKQHLVERSIEENRRVAIHLDQYALTLEKRHWKDGKISKEILKPVTTDFEPGKLNIIMGPSGSGKTSLLQSMSMRLKDQALTKYKPSGCMQFNGSVPSLDVVQSLCSFVTQDDDALLGSLTVRETLRFAAGLRLPQWMSKQEKNDRAEQVLLKMGLRDCADTLVGDELVKGISGGEKRRVTIAVQILTEPRVLLLDEPTSGLDAFTASSIVEVLRGLADEGRTLILTIHQSRSDLFQHFGNMLLLAREGHTVFSGPARNMVEHFASLGYQCPRDTNPADFALDLITIDLRQEAKEAETRQKVQNLIEGWKKDTIPRTQAREMTLPAELASNERKEAHFYVAVPLLVKRAMINFWRRPDFMTARIMQNIGFAIITAIWFAPLGHDYISIQNRLGFAQEIAPLYFIGMLQNIAVYPMEKDVFYREHDDRAYGVEAFFFQYTLIESGFTIITSCIVPALSVMAVGLDRTAAMYFIWAFNTFCIISCGESLGMVFNTLFENTGFAVNLTSVFLSLAQTMGGTMSLRVPSFLNAFNWLSPVKYTVGNIAPYCFRGVKFTCNDYQRLPDGSCPVQTGEQVLKMYNLDNNAPMFVMGLGLCTIVYRLVAFLLLKAIRERWFSLRFWKEKR